VVEGAAAVIGRVPPSVWGVAGFDADERLRHAARLLWSGYDIESAAVLSGLPVEQARELATSVADPFAARGSP
jgi:hypothetical protein